MKIRAKRYLEEDEEAPERIPKPTKEEVQAKVQREEYLRYINGHVPKNTTRALTKPEPGKNFWLSQHDELVKLYEDVARRIAAFQRCELQEFLREITLLEKPDVCFHMSDVGPSRMTFYIKEEFDQAFHEHTLIGAMMLYAMRMGGPVSLMGFGADEIRVHPNREVEFKDYYGFGEGPKDDEEEEEQPSLPDPSVIDI